MVRPTRLIALVLAILSLPVLCFAGSHVGFGVALDGFMPLDREMYGEKMTNNAWGRKMFDLNYSAGKARTNFPAINRYDFILSPVFTESYFWDFGLGLEFSQQIQYLFFSPNKDVDVTFDRFMVPLRFTAKWTFAPKKKVQPFLGCGPDLTYVISHISGKDLYDQRKNPDFANSDGDDLENTPDAQDSSVDRHLTVNREFGRSDWYWGFHAVLGTNVNLEQDLALVITLRYDYLPIETLDAELVRTAEDEWHWEDETTKGDAGGFAGSIGVRYSF